MADLRGGGRQLLAQTSFTEGKSSITINGLVWMGDRDTMARRIREKLDAGFSCVKLKIGGIDFDEELGLLPMIRREFGPDDIALRLDANGAFCVDNALERLKRLSEYHIHSIEQPLKAGQWEAMAQLCSVSPIPIALDEELIGFSSDRRKAELLATIQPAYVILKPALCGGFAEADRWIDIAGETGHRLSGPHRLSNLTSALVLSPNGCRAANCQCPRDSAPERCMSKIFLQL